MKRVSLTMFQALIVVLLALGVVSATKRGIAVLGTQPDALDREQLDRVVAITGLEVDSPEHRRLAREIPAMSRGLNQRPFATAWHLLPGAAFFILVPLQFSRRIRARYPALHRWNGRVLLALVSAAAVAGIYLGIASAYGGIVESVATTVFGGWSLFAGARGLRAIRRRDMARHREWMIRMFSIAIGIAVIRIVGMASLLLFGTQTINARAFGVSLWAGWLLSAAIGELWILRTRPRRVAESMALAQPL